MPGERIEKNRGGRPPERDEAKRAPISMRITPATRGALDEAAQRQGRSLAQEVEQRLERSIEMEAERGGPATAALVQAIIADIAEIEARTGKSWQSDHETHAAVARAILFEIADRQPPDQPGIAEAYKQASLDAKVLQGAYHLLSEAQFYDIGGGTPVTALTAEQTESIEARIPALERQAEASYSAAEALYAPINVARQRGRALFNEIRRTKKRDWRIHREAR